MMVSVPAMAPDSPPETGASSITTPRACSPAAISRAAAGAMVLMSTYTSPGRAPSATACATSATWGASGTQEKTTSDAAATSAMLPRASAPAATTGASDAARRAHTLSAKPALRRLSAMGRPIRPRPINPMFMHASPNRSTDVRFYAPRRRRSVRGAYSTVTGRPVNSLRVRTTSSLGRPRTMNTRRLQWSSNGGVSGQAGRLTAG